MSTTIHVVQVIRANGTGSTKWFWDQSEATFQFGSALTDRGAKDTVTRFRIDVDEAIADFIEDAIQAGTAEVMDSRGPEDSEVPEYTTLRYDTQNHEILYIERTFGGEFWAYTVEKRHNNSWKVKEQMGGEMIGRIYQDDATALLPSYSVELRADTDPVAHGASLQEAVEKLIGTVSGDFGEVK